MKFEQTKLAGVIHLCPETHDDVRGFFRELVNKKKLAEAGINCEFVQFNHSRSTANVLRGLHFQHPNPQGKLVSAVEGKIFDVAVDLRKNSPTFGNWVGFELDSETGNQLYIPPQFAHGFAVISERADVIYACTDFYSPEGDRGIRWNDPDINVTWPLDNPVLSEKDQKLPYLKDIETSFGGEI